MNFIVFCILLILSAAGFQAPLQSISAPHNLNAIQKLAAPYLIPEDHPIKGLLDYLFSQSRATENQMAFEQAGFEIITITPLSLVIVALHPAFPGYIFKVYLDSETRIVRRNPHRNGLVARCQGARRIRRVIREKKLRYFSVPDKWLYVLPEYPLSGEQNPQPFILIETDMQIDDLDTSKKKWRRVKSKQLDELYEILKLGYGSVSLAQNVPSTKNGTFAFIDTEFPKRNLQLHKIKKFLSPEMRNYWDGLIEK